jgi:pimeloyl-ACP methyl ester carboxylesterase
MSVVAAVALVASASSPAGAARDDETSAARIRGDVREMKLHYLANGGRRRIAFLLVPRSYGWRNHPPLPLVIAPHGRGAGPFFGQAQLWGQLPAHGKFAVVIPEGQGRRLAHHSWGYAGQIDDLARMPDILARALPWLRLDRRRVYAVGGSMGGQESLLLVARHPRLLAGAVAIDAPVELARRYEQVGTLPNAESLRTLMRTEVGGTPAEMGDAYAARSPLRFAKQIAAAGVPLQLWWSTRDELVVDQASQSGRLYTELKRLGPRAPLIRVVGSWKHVAKLRWDGGLPAALRFLGLLRIPERCKAGFRYAVIGGRRHCLAPGQRCSKRIDREYHHYGFHCHTGRLRSASSDITSQRVDVGGYRLAMTCGGTGSPTVVLESGFGTSGQTFSFVGRRLAGTTRICWYDRAGVGESEARPVPGPVPAVTAVEELHRLLTRALVPPPYVLGGWSFGGFFARLYTKRYPAEVAGLVSVDGTPAGLPPGRPDIDLVQGDNESFFMAAADAEVAASPSLGTRPLVVLTRGIAEASPDLEALWLKLQKQVARLSTSAMLVRAERAGHSIHLQAEDLTVAAFRQVIGAVRRQAPLANCASTPLLRLGGTCLDPTSAAG